MSTFISRLPSPYCYALDALPSTYASRRLTAPPFVITTTQSPTTTDTELEVHWAHPSPALFAFLINTNLALRQVGITTDDFHSLPTLDQMSEVDARDVIGSIDAAWCALHPLKRTPSLKYVENFIRQRGCVTPLRVLEVLMEDVFRWEGAGKKAIAERRRVEKDKAERGRRSPSSAPEEEEDIPPAPDNTPVHTKVSPSETAVPDRAGYAVPPAPHDAAPSHVEATASPKLIPLPLVDLPDVSVSSTLAAPSPAPISASVHVQFSGPVWSFGQAMATSESLAAPENPRTTSTPHPGTAGVGIPR